MLDPPFAAMVPNDGSGVATTGVHVAPNVCVNTKLFTAVFVDAEGPGSVTFSVHSLALDGPDLAVMLAPSALGGGAETVKYATGMSWSEIRSGRLGSFR